MLQTNDYTNQITWIGFGNCCLSLQVILQIRILAVSVVYKSDIDASNGGLLRELKDTCRVLTKRAVHKSKNCVRTRPTIKYLTPHCWDNSLFIIYALGSKFDIIKFYVNLLCWNIVTRPVLWRYIKYWNVLLDFFKIRRCRGSGHRSSPVQPIISNARC